MRIGCVVFLWRPALHRFVRRWRAVCRGPNGSNSAISPATPCSRDFGEDVFSSRPILSLQEGRADPSSAPLCLPDPLVTSFTNISSPLPFLFKVDYTCWDR